jgi:integrase
VKGNLTKRIVDAAQPADADHFLWDGEVKGFGLKITPAGRKVYVLQSRLRGKLRRFTIGVHGSPWTVDQARDQARRMLTIMLDGQDPTDKASARASLTVAEVCDRYLKEACDTKKPSTIVIDRGRIARHIKPLLGNKLVREVDHADVVRFMRDIADGKTAASIKTVKRGRARVRGGKGAATRTVGLLGSIFTFAVQEKLRPDNPVKGIAKYEERKFNRVLKLHEMKDLAKAVLLEAQNGNPSAAQAILFLFLTGCRKGEALTLRWSYIDFDGKSLRLPESKSGAKLVPLGDPAIKLLKSIPRVEKCPFVFAGHKPGSHLIGLQKAWERVKRAARLEDLRLHDLRHNFISVGASGGESLYILGKVAGHTNAATTQRYAHLQYDPVREAANRIATQIGKHVKLPRKFASS